ncbi:hypothetical protein, partial [Pseudomonas syringae group genomosp. 7]|uniref:hypothetical protein n=1 Tax=Pseudomonas syringae group genomosp. 7 TaxID=251699 RepID=UPI00377014A8
MAFIELGAGSFFGVFFLVCLFWFVVGLCCGGGFGFGWRVLCVFGFGLLFGCLVFGVGLWVVSGCVGGFFWGWGGVGGCGFVVVGDVVRAVALRCLQSRCVIEGMISSIQS